MDNTKLTVMVLLDFSSALNSVDFDMLLGALRAVNIFSSAINLFSSYLFDQQCIKANNTTSPWLELTARIPQGGVLSPLLFSVFTNNISKVITFSFHLYADDLQLYRHSNLNELPKVIESLKIISVLYNLGRNLCICIYLSIWILCFLFIVFFIFLYFFFSLLVTALSFC